MLNKLIRFFLVNPLVAWLLMIFFIGWGVSVAPFNWNVGILPRDPVPVDAIPDIGENLQIIFTQWMGRSPQDIEDQITYPLTSALLGIPGVTSIRSTSMFGFSSIYVIFDEDVEYYWSRPPGSRASYWLRQHNSGKTTSSTPCKHNGRNYRQKSATCNAIMNSTTNSSILHKKPGIW